MGWPQCDFGLPQCMAFEITPKWFLSSNSQDVSALINAVFVWGQVCVKSERRPRHDSVEADRFFSRVGRDSTPVCPHSWCLKSHPDGLLQVGSKAHPRFSIRVSFWDRFVSNQTRRPQNDSVEAGRFFSWVMHNAISVCFNSWRLKSRSGGLVRCRRVSRPGFRLGRGLSQTGEDAPDTIPWIPVGFRMYCAQYGFGLPFKRSARCVRVS